MDILVYPPTTHTSANPLNGLFYSQIEKSGATVAALYLTGALPAVQICHVHWPDLFVVSHRDNSPKDYSDHLQSNLRRLSDFLAQLEHSKAQGARVVWTLHNVQAHEGEDRFLAAVFWPRFYRLVDGVIFLTESAKQIASARIPALADIPSKVIPRGNLNTIAENMPTRAVARQALGIEDQEFVYCYFGKIRPYKNVPALVTAFMQQDIHNSRLIVAGNDQHDFGIADEIAKTTDGIANIITDFRHVPDDDLLTYIAASDIVVLPYKEILNSASLLLALACRRRVICPDSGSLGEIAKAIGDDWMFTYDGPFNGATLKAAYEKYGQTVPSADLSYMDRFAWPKVAAETLDFFSEVMTLPARSQTAELPSADVPLFSQSDMDQVLALIQSLSGHSKGRKGQIRNGRAGQPRTMLQRLRKRLGLRIPILDRFRRWIVRLIMPEA